MSTRQSKHWLQSLHSDMPDSQRKGSSTFSFLLPADPNQVLGILLSFILLFHGSLLPPKVLHSIKIRVKIVWADAHSASRVSPCTLPRRVRTEFSSKGAVGDQGLFGTNSTEFWLQSRIYLLPCSKPPRLFTLSIWYLYCHRQPKPLPPLHLASHAWPCATLPLTAGAIWLLSAVLKLWLCRARAGRQKILTETAQPPGRDTHGEPGCFGKGKYVF